MANTTQRGRKPSTEVNTPVVNEVEEVKAMPEKKKFADTDVIRCESITVGRLGMTGLKSKIHYEWQAQGDVTEVEYQDLVSAVRSRKSHIFKPLFIIKDDDFLAEFPQVENAYSNMYSTEDLIQVFDLDPESMRMTIQSLPTGIQKSIRDMSTDMIQTGVLDSIQKIKVLDELFDINLLLMNEFIKRTKNTHDFSHEMNW